MGLASAGCHQPAGGVREHVPTPLPIDLFTLDEATRQHILDMHEQDTSPYLVETRPVLFQIQGVGNRQNQMRGPVTFDRPVRLMIYALGETCDAEWCDHGWIHTPTGEVVWRMELAASTHGGGDERNRKIVDHIELPAGTYTLRYDTNATHSFAGWIGEPPERPHYYGITVFNLAAIERIREETGLE